MARDWVVVGDKTASGGVVISGSSYTDVDGKPVAREKDKATCPRHNGVFAITSAGCDHTTIIDGAPVALHGAYLTCGCQVLAVQQHHVFVDSAPSRRMASAASKPVAVMSVAGGAPQGLFEEQFRAIDPGTGMPVEGVQYRIELGGGVIHTGKTDQDGLTIRVKTPMPEQVRLTWLQADDDECEFEESSMEGC